MSPYSIEFTVAVQFVKPHDPNGVPQAPFGLCCHPGDAVSRDDIKSKPQHSLAVTA